MIVRIASGLFVTCTFVGLSFAACSSTPASGEQTSFPNTTVTPPVSGAAGASVPASAGSGVSAVAGGAAKGAAGVPGITVPSAGHAAGPAVVPTAGMMSASAAAGAAGSTMTAAAAAGGGGVLTAGTGAAGMAGALAAGSGAAGAAGGSSQAAACTGMPLSVGDHEYTIDSKNGLKYSYILTIPKTVDPMQRAPLIIHWHALTSDPEEARSLTSIDAKAEAAKAIVVYPRSPDKSWDTGSCCTSTSGGKMRDEEVFARELVKDVQEKACVDDKRIYTNGFSNGGMMSQLLACKMADVFAAAAPMGSTLTIDKDTCKPSRPIPMFMINGTADPLVGYNMTSFSGGLTVPDDIKFWADKNQCMGEPEMFLQMGKATCKRYTKCAAGVELDFCAVEGMGHCVPGMKKESATNCLTKSIIALGPPNDDIDGLQLSVDFLMRYTLP